MNLTLSLHRPQVPDLGINVSLDEDAGAEIAEVLESANNLPTIRDDRTLEICISKAAEVKALLSAIEESRVTFKQPFLKACQSIDAFAKRCSKSLTDLYADITTSIALYEGARRREREAEKARLEAEVAALAKAAHQAHNAGDEQGRAQLIEQAQTAAIAANQVVQPTEGMSIRKQYRFEIENLEEVWKFNRRLLVCTINHAACMDLVRMMKEAGTTEFKIPGIKVIEETKAQIRGAR
jgi:hypothetical protein